MQIDQSLIRACCCLLSFGGLWAQDPTASAEDCAAVEYPDTSRRLRSRPCCCGKPRPLSAVQPGGISAWALKGNAGTISGTTGSELAGTNFIGTTNAQNLEVRLNSSSATFFRFTQEGALEFINPSYSTFLGLEAGLNNTGQFNVAIGYATLNNTNVGNRNTAVGALALLANRGDYNTAVGTSSLGNNLSGVNNSAFGTKALELNTTGSNNTAIGCNALSTYNTGTGITCVGYGADVDAGGYQNASAFGNGAIVKASNSVVIGNSSVTSIGGYANWTVLSDGRFKNEVQENVPGLHFIKNLRPITYRLDLDKLERLTHPRWKGTCVSSASTQAEIVKTGLIAQEVESAALESGFDFDGVVKPQNEHDHYRLSYASLVVPLIKAIQEQQAMIEALQREVQSLKQ